MIAELPAAPSRPMTPADIVKDVRCLPSAPRMLPRLKSLLGDGNSSMDEITALIRFDAGIVARVLRMANSPYFGGGLSCATLDDAVQRVGYDQVYELVSYAVASQVLVRPLEVYGLEADELWRQSVCGALAAEVLARRTGQDQEAAYTVGMLQGVGMVAIDEWALRHARGLKLSRVGFPAEATAAERTVFGFTQAEVGGELLRLWGFPETIAEPVRWQYAPLAAAGRMPMTTLLSAAKWLRDAVCGLEPGPAPAAQLAAIELSPTLLEALVEEVERRLVDANSLLETSHTAEQRRPAPEVRMPACHWE